MRGPAEIQQHIKNKVIQQECVLLIFAESGFNPFTWQRFLISWKKNKKDCPRDRQVDQYYAALHWNVVVKKDLMAKLWIFFSFVWCKAAHQYNLSINHDPLSEITHTHCCIKSMECEHTILASRLAELNHTIWRTFSFDFCFVRHKHTQEPDPGKGKRKG